MNFRYNLLKQIIESKTPGVNMDDVLLLSMSFLSQGKIDQVQYDELQTMINNTTV